MTAGYNLDQNKYATPEPRLQDWTTLPQFFKENGWRSIGHGKIFHEGNASGFPRDQDQMFGSWSVPFFHPTVVYNKYSKTNPDPTGTGKGVIVLVENFDGF